MSDDETYTADLVEDEDASGTASPAQKTITVAGSKPHPLLAFLNGDGMYDVWKTDSKKLEDGVATYRLFEHNMPDPGDALLLHRA